MKITADNYEQWALDYLEGTLSAPQREAFERFLAADSRASEQIRSLEEYTPVARAEKIAFPDPASLRRGRGITPLRRLLSLVSGAAAAALIAGAFTLLDRTAGPSPTAEYHSPQLQTSPAPETIVAEMHSPEPAVLPMAMDHRSEPAGLPAAPDHRSEPVSLDHRSEPVSLDNRSERVSARNAAPGSSRLREWNRKTAGLLRRMEERSDRHNEQAKLMAAAARTETGQETPQSTAPASRPESEDLLATAAAPRHKAAFLTGRAKERSRTAQDNASINVLSLLPPDAATPILTENSSLREEYQPQEYRWSDEPRNRREGGLLRSLLNPIEKISPIKYYETEEGRGVEIASILRIGSRNN